MAIVGEYLKSKLSNLIVKVTELNLNMGRFSAIVIVPIATKHVGKEINMLNPAYFGPYTPTPQELIEWGETDTLTNDNPNKVEVDDKDVNLRLECLKLASNNKNGQSKDYIIRLANNYYEWITQKPLTND